MSSIVFGLIACALGAWGIFTWWWSVAEFLRGFLPVGLVLFGLVAIGAGLSSKKIEDIPNDKAKKTK
ncbi:MAG: hypothetical protein HQM14_21260 [SAR324 cluster bacterium]|nr:hypothetical protein [SAR324 cluster bacterium]